MTATGPAAARDPHRPARLLRAEYDALLPILHARQIVPLTAPPRVRAGQSAICQLTAPRRSAASQLATCLPSHLRSTRSTSPSDAAGR